MRVGNVSPWFRASMAREYDSEALRLLEPRDARLTGITDRHHVFHTATVIQGDRIVEAVARTAPEALRQALAKLHAAERVEIVSLLSPETAA